MSNDDVVTDRIEVPIERWADQQILGSLSLSLSDLERLPGSVDVQSLVITMRGALAHLAGYEERAREKGAIPLNEDVWLDIKIQVSGRAVTTADQDLTEETRQGLEEFITSRRISRDVNSIQIALPGTVSDDGESESL